MRLLRAGCDCQVVVAKLISCVKMCWTRPIKVQLEGTSHRQRRFNSVSLNGERARSIRKFVTSCFVQFPGLFWGIFWNVDVADVKKFVDGVCTCMHNLALERLESGSSGWCKNWALWSRPLLVGVGLTPENSSSAHHVCRYAETDSFRI